MSHTSGTPLPIDSPSYLPGEEMNLTLAELGVYNSLGGAKIDWNTQYINNEKVVNKPLVSDSATLLSETEEDVPEEEAPSAGLIQLVLQTVKQEGYTV